MFKKAIALTGLIAAMAVSTAASAATIIIEGTADTFGVLAGLVPPGSAFSGELEWNDGTSRLDGGQVLLGNFCFTDDATGGLPSADPLASPDCGALSPVPILADGQAVYDPAGNVGPYDQTPATTFDGTSGVVDLLTFSPTFGINIPIALTFNGDGTGSILADAGALGGSTGDFTVVPVPAAAWLFGSALFGLAGVARRKAKA